MRRTNIALLCGCGVAVLLAPPAIWEQNGSILAWGRNNQGQGNVPDPNTGFVADAAGTLHSPGLGGMLCNPCDTNCDGSVDLADVEPFLDLLEGTSFPCDTCAGDTNADGSVNDGDINGFAACLFPYDSDGDRLLDIWETDDGVFIDFTQTGTDPDEADTDGDGIDDGDEVLGTLDGLDLPTLGASPLRKDIFVEIDWMTDSKFCGAHSHQPNAQPMNKLVTVFAAAPASNPYSAPTGITLHIDYGQTGGPGKGTFIGTEIEVGWDVEFNSYKDVYFDSNRKGYFHYAIFCHENDYTSGHGVAEINGDDFIVSVKCFGNGHVSKTTMHELGHNLNLRHGGNTNLYNYAPNYNSIMNYRYVLTGLDSDCDADGQGDGGVLDYSDGSLGDLNESDLNEFDGICGAPYSIDWDGDGTLEVSVVRNINCKVGGSTACDDTNECVSGFSTECTNLVDYDDWSNIDMGNLLPGDAPRETIRCQFGPSDPQATLRITAGKRDVR